MHYDVATDKWVMEDGSMKSTEECREASRLQKNLDDRKRQVQCFITRAATASV